MSLLQTATFRNIMYFKFFMVIVVWGLTPLLIPAGWLPFLGLHLTSTQVLLLRSWGVIVLGDFFVYWYIFKRSTTKLVRYFMLFAVLDNGGFGLFLIFLTLLSRLPWGIWANIPFQLFFGYGFWRFYRANITGVSAGSIE